MSELVNAYIKLRQTRAVVKVRQKQELADETRPELIALGRAVKKQRATMTIEQIKSVIGNRNGNLLYEALTALEAENEPTPAPTIPAPQTGSERYTLTEHAKSGSWHVDFAGFETYVVDRHNGQLITPPEWAEHSPERRALYKEILNEIRAKS